MRLRSRVNELFTQSRSAADSRSILSMMQEDGEQIGRFKVRGLIRILGLISQQSGSHAYNKTTVERPDIPNSELGKPIAVVTRTHCRWLTLTYPDDRSYQVSHETIYRTHFSQCSYGQFSLEERAFMGWHIEGHGF